MDNRNDVYGGSFMPLAGPPGQAPPMGDVGAQHRFRSITDPPPPVRHSYHIPSQPQAYYSHRQNLNQARPATSWGQITVPPPVPPPPPPHLYARTHSSPPASSPGAGPSNMLRASSYMDILPEYAPAGFTQPGRPDEKVRPPNSRPSSSSPPPPPKPHTFPSPPQTSSDLNARPPSASFSFPPPPPIPLKNFDSTTSTIPPPPLPPKLQIPSSFASPFDDEFQSESPLPDVPTDAEDHNISEEDQELEQALRMSSDSFQQEERLRREALPNGEVSEEDLMREAIAMSLAQEREEQMEALRRIEMHVMANGGNAQPIDDNAMNVQPPIRHLSSASLRPPQPSPHYPTTILHEVTNDLPPTTSSAPMSIDMSSIRNALPDVPTHQGQINGVSPALAAESWDEEMPLPLYEEVSANATASARPSLLPPTPGLTSSPTPTSESSRSRTTSNISPLTTVAADSHFLHTPAPIDTPSTYSTLGLSRSPSSPTTGASSRPEGSSLSPANRLRASRSFTVPDLHDQLWGASSSEAPVPSPMPVAMPVPNAAMPAAPMVHREPVAPPVGPSSRQIILEKEYAEGVSFGYRPPMLDMTVLPDPPPLPETILIYPDSAFHVCAPSWHQLLRLLARIGDVSLQPSPEAFGLLPDSGEISVRLVLHFHKCRYGDQWKTILWVDLNRSLPSSISPKDAWPYINGDTTILPYQCQIPRDAGVYFQRPATGEINTSSTSITYVLPQRLSPTIPMRMDVLAAVLTDAYRSSQSAVSTGAVSPPPGSLQTSSLDVGLSLKRLCKAIDKCYNSSGKSKERPAGGVLEVSKKDGPGQVFVGKQSLGRWLSSGVRNVLPTNRSSKGGKHGNDENYDLVTPFTG
ncbi:hypothetical protein FRB95_012337 [Tulasnella sp. JGI-2019a]|nr:hypothetical protein FRB95_012337 [Tulasnella sp. JGI-2019a]